MVELTHNRENSHEPSAPEQALLEDQTDPTVSKSLGQLPNLHSRLEGNRLMLSDIRGGYPKDSLFAKVLKDPEHHKNFKLLDGLLYTHNHVGDTVLCIPLVVPHK